MLLGALTNLILSAAEVMVVIMAGTLMLQFGEHRRAQGIMQRFAGSTLVLLALHLGLGGSLF